MQPLIAAPLTAALIYRAHSHNSLTPAGILVAALTALIHALHPWSVFFALLCAFFLAGTAVTKVKADVKSGLTLRDREVVGEKGGGGGGGGGGKIERGEGGGGEGPRTHVQVLANSAVASLLVLVHAWALYTRDAAAAGGRGGGGVWELRSAVDYLPFGIFANYAAVAADTFSSELGILSSVRPVMITNLWKRAAPGTNGGVTVLGTVAGFGGSLVMAVVAVVLTPFGASWTVAGIVNFFLLMTVWGGVGSLVDSILGATLQKTAIDGKTGKVIEGKGGREVGKRSGEKVANAGGYGLLDNNGVNFLMAAIMSLGGILIARLIF